MREWVGMWVCGGVGSVRACVKGGGGAGGGIDDKCDHDKLFMKNDVVNRRAAHAVRPALLHTQCTVHPSMHLPLLPLLPGRCVAEVVADLPGALSSMRVTRTGRPFTFLEFRSRAAAAAACKQVMRDLRGEGGRVQSTGGCTHLGGGCL